MEKNHKICVGITACLVLILSIVALVLVFLLKTKDSSSNLVVNDLQKNFKSKGFNDITYSASNNCPTGTEPLFNWQFPGTDTICLCTNDETGNKKLVSIYKSACVFVSGYTCKKTKMDPALMHRFKGKMLCGRPSEYSYEGYENIAKNGTCSKADWRVCGHTEGRKLCLPKTSTCPINSVIITKTNLDPTKLVEGDYKTIKLEDDYKIYFSNKKTGEKIITDFGAGYDPPCISPRETKVPTDYNTSGLDGNMYYTEECEDTMGTSSAYDPRWKKEIEYSRKDLFNDNNYFQNYESSKAIDMRSLGAKGHYIYSRGYSDWNRACTSDPNKSISENFEQLKSTQEGESKYGLSVAAIVLLFVAIISALIWLVYAFTKNANPSFIKCCCIWLCLLLLAIIVILVLLFIRATKDYPENSGNWMKENCGDSTTSGLLQNIVGNKSRFLKYVAWALGLTTLAWLLLCCLPCCLGRGKANFDEDVMRSNRRSNYTELVEDDYQDQVFNPNAGYQAYPEVRDGPVIYKRTVETEVKSNYVPPPPEPVTTTYVQPERRVTTTYVPQEPQVTTTYVNREPQVTTTYVAQEPTTRIIQEPVTRTEYRTSQPEYTTTYVNQPNVTRTEYVQGEPQIIRTTENNPVTSNIRSNVIRGEPTSTVRYVNGTPTYTSSNIGSGIRTYDDQGRLITRDY